VNGVSPVAHMSVTGLESAGSVVAGFEETL